VDPEDAWDLIRKQLGRWAKCTDKSAHDRDAQDYEELFCREEEWQRSLKNQFLLQSHCVPDSHTDSNP